MSKYILLSIAAWYFFMNPGNAQTPFASISAERGFRNNDEAVSVYDSVANVYRLRLNKGNKIYRKIYDTSFTLLDEYSYTNSELLLFEKPSQTANFVTPFCSHKGYFEVYGTENMIVVYKPDFKEKKDREVWHIAFEINKKGGEKLLSVMPDADDLKLLTYSKEQNMLKVYRWIPGDSTRIYSYALPAKSMTKEEETIHDKASQVKLSSLWNMTFVSSKINSIDFLPKGNQLYYAGDKIYALMDIPYSLGRYVITIDLDKDQLTTHNYFVNKLHDKVSGNYFKKKAPVAMIFDSTLVIQNCTLFRFEFFFYNVNSHALIKKYSVPVVDSIYQLVHSPLIQKGTYGSRDEEKDISNGEAFMRKIRNSFWYINMTSLRHDSVAFTLAALKYTTGIEGTLLAAGTGALGSMAGLYVGNLQLIPYLTSHRYKLFYVHSKFSNGNFEPSKNGTITTVLDDIIDTFKVKELASSSSFYFQKNDEVFIGVLNTATDKFDIYKFRNNQ